MTGFRFLLSAQRSGRSRKSSRGCCTTGVSLHFSPSLLKAGTDKLCSLCPRRVEEQWGCIRNRPGTGSNGRDEQRLVEQASKHESIFKGDALAVESVMRKIAQELFVRSDLRVRLIDMGKAGL